MCNKYLDCACVFITLAESVTGAARALRRHLMLVKVFHHLMRAERPQLCEQSGHVGPVAVSAVPLSLPSPVPVK